MNILYVSNAETGAQHAALALFSDGSLKMALDDVTKDAKVSFDLSKMPLPFVLPNLTTTQRDAIVLPTAGSTIYNKTTNQTETFNGTNWVAGNSDNLTLPTITGNNFDVSKYRAAIWIPTGNADLAFSNLPSGVDYNLILYVINNNHSLTIDSGAVPIAPTDLTRITIDHIGGIPYYESDYTTGGLSQWTTLNNDIYYNTGKVFIGDNTDDNSGAKLQINGGINSKGIISTKGTTRSLNMQVAADQVNPSGDAGYIYMSEFCRLFLGTGSNPIYSLNLVNVNGIENMPGFRTLSGISFGSVGSHSIDRVGSDIVYNSSGPSGAHIFSTIGGTYGEYDSANEKFRINPDGTFKFKTLHAAPASSTDTGTVGDLRFTSSGIYICIATNTWIKSTATTF